MASLQIPAVIPDASTQGGGLPLSLIPGAAAQMGLFGKVLDALLGGGQALPADFSQPALDGMGRPPVQKEASGEGPSTSLPGAGLPDALLVLTAPEGKVPGAIPTGVPDAGASYPGEASLQAAAVGGVLLAMESRPVAPVLADVPEEAAVPTGGRGLPADLAGGRQILPEAVYAEALPGRSPEAARPDGAPPPAVPLASEAHTPPEGQVVLPAVERAHDLARTAAPVRESLAVQTPLRTQGWEGEFSQRVVWMVGRQTQWAEISLNPPHLGSVEVRLSMNGNEAAAQFFSPQSAVREAIEAGMPRLREMLASAGVHLGEAQVSAESFSDRRERGAGGSGGAFVGEEPQDQPLRIMARGMVDLYV